ncbi:hypothetical protein HY572_05760 [Candidatus Micrarchaeota archaeon]|nr:hypothetical protein [Candidatus Micrarchaeota archaeon]
MDVASLLKGVSQKPSVWVLLAANVVPLFGVLFLGWSQASVLLLFWAESAVIGFYTVLKMLLAKPERFDAPDGLAGTFFAGAAFAVFQASRLFSIGFFVIHFGIFMLVHLMFLLFFLVSDADPFGVLASVVVGGAAYFLSHGYSFVVNFLDRREYLEAEPKSLMAAPYPRVILMHVAVIFGAILGLPALVLVLGKMVLDLASHAREHGWFKIEGLQSSGS